MANLVSVISNETDKIRELVYEWLETVEVSPGSHQGAIVYGALLNGTNQVTGIHRYGSFVSSFADTVVAGIGLGAGAITRFSTIDPALADEINSVTDELKNPNIEGIPIHADAEIETTQNDVGKQMLIRQSAGNKEYFVDNSVPQLRTWSIQGLLMSNPHTDSQFVIKPSLIAQRELLQIYADSRRPVWYKTHDNKFHKVLISSFISNYDVKATNALFVKLELIEFKPLEIDEQNVATRIAELAE